MTTPTVATIVAHVRQRRQALVDAWLVSLKDVCRPTLGEEVLRANLDSLLGRIAASLGQDAFDPHVARAVGRDLADATCGQPEILGTTHLFLCRHFLVDLPAAEQEALQPLLASFLGHLALGFSIAAQRSSPALRDLVEEGRRAERRFYTTILDMVDALVSVVDAEGHIVGFNGACERVSGYTFDEAYGRHHTFTVAPEYHEQSRILVSRLKRLSRSRRKFIPYHSVWLTRDGQRRHIEWSTTAIFDDDGSLTYIISTGIDVTARRKMERELADAHRHVAQVKEAERLRLAQDLHDDAVQQLLGLSYQLADMQQRATEPGPWTPEQQLEELIPALEMTRGDIIAVAQELRRLISFLRPPALRELGLPQVLDAYVQEWQQRAGPDAPTVTLHLASLGEKQLPEAVAICIFRLVQEGLWNAQKHAAASCVSVSVDAGDDQILLRIRDDGCGFRIPPHLFKFATSGRFGFIGMQERVHAVDGILSVWSEPGQGTEIQAHIPLWNREAKYERSNTGLISGRSSSYS